MSDKTNAAIAAEQQAAATEESSAAQQAEALPAATLEELEEFDIGSVADQEAPRFRITDDRCADWAVRKIAEERAEYDRLKELADQQVAAITEKMEAAKRRLENGTSYLTSCLAEYFRTVPHKTTKTTEKYRLLSGTLTLKKGGTKATPDDAKLVPWLMFEDGTGIILSRMDGEWDGTVPGSVKVEKGDVTVPDGDVTASGISLKAHTHAGVHGETSGPH